MWTDPIVSEVRKAGEELARKADGDLHKFFSNLKSTQKQYADRLTRLKLTIETYEGKKVQRKAEGFSIISPSYHHKITMSSRRIPRSCAPRNRS